MGELWTTKSKNVGLIDRAVSFQDFQPMWSWFTNVTDGQMTCDSKTTLCTVVHHAVKTNLDLLQQEIVSGSGISWAICKSAPWARHITTPASHHSGFYKLDALPAAQPTDLILGYIATNIPEIYLISMQARFNLWRTWGPFSEKAQQRVFRVLSGNTFTSA